MPGKYDYAGVMPGSVTVGDIMQNTRQMQRHGCRPDEAERRDEA